MGFLAAAFQRRATIRRAPILPDDGVVNRLAVGAIPDDGGLALIGDANGDNLAEFFRFCKSLARRFKRRAPDIFRGVFNPSVLWIMLLELLLRISDNAAGPVKDDGAAGGRALINGENERRFEVCHRLFGIRG